ncbi:flagellin, partial [Rubripirellula amarantea]|nr:flagellin [Rubripirellula amarantea]
MTRINTNVPSLIAQNRLQSSNGDLNSALTRLSTGLRINSGSDDPAGLIASEALRSEITSLGKAITNTNRASQIISTADSALGEVSNLLNDIRGLVVEAANSGALSDEEVAANQLQIDSSLEAINRIAQTTTFQGRKLLDGSLDFQSTASSVSAISDINIDQANLGAIGNINVDVNIKAAATRASISTTGIPTSTTSTKSTGSLTFSSPSPDAEAAGTVSLANSYTIGAEATGTVALANAFAPDGEATTGAISLGSGATLTIAATDGGLADGSKGNDTIINLTTNTTGTTVNYDANTDTLSVSLQEGLDETALAAALSGISADFGFTVGGTGTTDSGDAAGFLTGQFSGGTDVSGTAQFTLTAVDGGAADGLKGDSTNLVLTSGASTSVSYDADNDILNVTVADGATVADIAAAINSTVGSDFIASNVVDGSYTYAAADNGTTNPITGGTDPTSLGQFDIEAVNGQLADGTAGNGATINFTSGATTEAIYDPDANIINITVADGATVADIASAINADGNFLTRNVQNGNALFGASDLGSNDPSLLAGTDTTSDDVITVTADDASADFDGRTINVVADNSLAAGTASASLDSSGNIVVNVSSNGPVGVGSIASAINNIEGFSASVTASDGDGSFDILTDTTPTSVDLTGGVFGGGLNADLVVQLRGSQGSEVFQFEKGATLESIVQ